MKSKLLLLIILVIATITRAHGQCADCTPDESCTTDILFPIICPEILPDATAGEYYETVLTFFLPPELEDPGSGFIVSLDAVIINQVTGIPFGLSFQLSEEDNTYNPSQGQQFGCATVCGTPLLPGEYLITVFVTAEVTVFGFSQSANESFSQLLTVLPGMAGNTGFTIDNLASCDVLEINAEALIDGAPGITTYSWDFDNGQFSNLATPPTIMYSEPGDYTISLTTSISNYSLQSISVSSFQDSWSGDVEEVSNFLAPDPYFSLTNGDGAIVYSGGTIDDVFSATWSDLNVVLDNPPYTVSFYDEDTFTQDDFLGSGSFNVANGVVNFTAGGTSGFVVIGITPGPVFENEEVVSVFPQPVTDLSFDELNTELSLEDEELDSFTWYFMGDTIEGENSSSIILDQPGVYSASVTNIYGCSGQSEEFILCPSPAIIFNEVLDVLQTQPGNASYQWSYNGLPVPDSDSDTLPFQGLGNYAVQITTDYGCSESSQVYILSTEVYEIGNAPIFTVYPNPASETVFIELEQGRLNGASLSIYDLQGRLIVTKSLNQIAFGQRIQLNINDLNSGSYIVEIESQGRTSSQRLVVN